MKIAKTGARKTTSSLQWAKEPVDLCNVESLAVEVVFPDPIQIIIVFWMP